jgi:SSS family solute:Na+ symporter
MEIDALAWQDWAVVIAYALVVLCVGWRFSRRSESEEEYFLGGRSMSPFLIGISLFASLLSTVSYLAYPGEIIQMAPSILLVSFRFQ